MVTIDASLDSAEGLVRTLGSTAKRLFIDGQWVEALSGETFETLNPATGERLADVALGAPADIDRAVDAARRAIDDGPWGSMAPADRSKIIWTIGELIDANLEELAVLESIDNGKPRSVARLADIPGAAAMFRYFAGWATKIEGNTIALSAPGAWHAYTRKEPVGVVGQIIPWNFPLLIASWKLAPALAAGCTIVLKPAEQTPLTALRLGELMAQAGLPKGVVNIVTGFGDVGAALASHDRVDKVSFTGSTEVGKSVVHAATGNLKRLTLELGGKSPNIVFDDADTETAILGASNAIFFNHGQSCSAGSRLYVEAKSFDRVVAGVVEFADKIKLGPGLEVATDMGPLVSDEQLRRVVGYLDSGVEQGARVATGGNRVGDRGYFVAPTVLVDTSPDMKVVREEIFGPVVTATPFKDPEEIVGIANDTMYGLAAGVWTRDIRKGHRVAGQIKAGTVWINCYQAFDPALPFGGYRQSGWGREMGHEALEPYLETKSVCVSL